MNRISRRANFERFVAPGVGFLGGLSYLVLTLGHAHGQVSVLDEGLYLYKGYLFATGVFKPFQDFGPLTNHMPLSFLIPGWVQLIFGPGIRTGRYFAVFLGVLMLLGLWLTTRRLIGMWWANAAIWAVVVNPALLKMYSQATSQVLISCMLVWTLFLVLGEDRKRWHIFGGVSVAGLLLLTRINLAPVLFILLIYITWKYGWKLGIQASIVAVLVVGIGHAFYWPEILKLWAKWIPQAWSPFLDLYRLPADAVPFWDPAIRQVARLGSLKNGLTLHLISIVGFLAMSFALLTHKGINWSRSKSGTLWFLVSLYAVLFTLHAEASLGLNYCVYCLRNYIAFFSPVGLILFGIMGDELRYIQGRFRQISLFIMLVIAPFAFGMPLSSKLVGSILATDVPRVSGSSIQPGTLELSFLLQNKFGLEYENFVTIGLVLLYSTFIVGPLLIYYIVNRENGSKQPGVLGARLFASAAAFVLFEYSMASIYFGNSYQEYDCGQDVILSVEAAGWDLDRKLTQDSLVYWGVGQSPVALLYRSGGSVYPPQLNGDYTYMLSGDPVELLRFGYWDASLAVDWISQADYLLVDEANYSGLRIAGFEEERYDEIDRTPPTNPCDLDSSIMIFQRQ